jgi:hypothetical protein
MKVDEIRFTAVSKKMLSKRFVAGIRRHEPYQSCSIEHVV